MIEKILPWFIATLIRTVCATLRIRVEDRCGLRDGRIDRPVIWAFWHNRMFVMPVVYFRYYRHRNGAVLTSASKDGALLANVMLQFGVQSIRGSSSRRGTAATLELASLVERGGDAVITPDGPRGPCYQLGPGIIFLAQKTGTPVIPIRVEYSRAVRLKSWDRFMIPLPFSRVEVEFGKPFSIPTGTGDEEQEGARDALEKLMEPATP